MLNLFNLKENNKVIKSLNTKRVFYKKTSKHFPSPLREWKNSIYFYNKNSVSLIPSTTLTTNKIIKSYFNLYNNDLEAKMRTKRLLLRLRKLSSNRYYISSGGFKHTNNKVLINLYVFNRQKTNYLLTLKNWFLKTLLKDKTTIEKKITIKMIKLLKIINEKGIQAIKTVNKDKYLLIKALNTVLNNKKYNINTFKNLSEYTENFYKNLIGKYFSRIKMYFYYKQLLYVNRSKLNYTYLQFLKKQLEMIFSKNVEFNLINVKRFYNNSDIISESIILKLARNRRGIIRYLSSLKNKINIKKSSMGQTSYPLKIRDKQNLSQNKLLLQNFIINNLKYKHLKGFRLEAKGRLSRRFTASRSVYKVRYKGNLLDIDSSYKGLSSVILKGNLKSSIQYTKMSSKTRIGSFGIKGWISGN